MVVNLPNWSGNFCSFSAGKTLETNPDSVAIFITALMKRLENNIQLNVSRWKFNVPPNQHFKKGYKTDNKFSENCIGRLIESQKESNCPRFFLL